MSSKYMPSEIARLVFGYLCETNCFQTGQLFLQESPYLKEFAEGWRQGIQYSTKINGKTLIQMLNDQPTKNENFNNNNNNNSQDLSKIQFVTNDGLFLSNNNQPITSTPIIITSSMNPMLSNQLFLLSNGNQVNKVDSLNSQTNNQDNNDVVQQNVEQNIFKTPSKYDVHDYAKSPRRKGLPKRLVSTPVSSHKIHSSPSLSFKSPSSESSLNDQSSPMPNSNSSQMSIDTEQPVVQPELIVEELINFPPLHETIADKINKLFNVDGSVSDLINNLNNSQEERSSKDDSQKTITSEDVDLAGQEIPLNDTVVQNIIASLETAPEFNTLLDMITEKELQMTPFKVNQSPFSTSSANSSLNTPVPKRSSLTVNSNANVIKNLMTDLKTPEKSQTITLLPQSTIQINSVKTPIKISNCTASQKTLVNFINNSQINETVSIVNSNNKPNVMTSQGEQVIIRVDSSQSQQQQLTSEQVIKTTPQTSRNYFADLRAVKGKKINFNKPSSELQMKKGLTPRKILPKTTTSMSITTTATSTATTTSTSTLSTKTSTLSKNESQPNNLTELSVQRICKLNNKRVIRTLDFHSQLNNSENNQSKKHENEKELIIDLTEQNKSPKNKKLKMTQLRMPAVNILRKMNVNKFLDQVHSNQQ